MSARMDRWKDVVSGALVVCAIGMTAAVVHKEFFRSRSPTPEISRHIDGYERLQNDRPAVLGAAGAPVSIVEFSDYECPFCADLEGKLRSVVSRHAGKVAVYRYEIPAKNAHKNAYSAALAAKCAEKFGRHAEFERVLFKESSQLAGLDFARLAADAGVPVDSRAFSECMSSKEIADMLAVDKKKADELGISGTPTIIIDGDVIVGTMSEASLEKFVLRNPAL